MKKWSFNLLLAIACTFSSLAAEIEVITINWLQGLCIGSCINTVTNQFRRLNGTAELLLNPLDAEVRLRWKPYAPFRIDAITNTMSAAGLRSRDIRFRVRGTISRSGRAWILRSMGDNTSFILLGPAQVAMNRFTPTRNIDVHALSSDLQERLGEAERKFVVVTIEGPLFRELRQAGIYLVIERMTFHRLGRGAIPRN